MSVDYIGLGLQMIATSISVGGVLLGFGKFWVRSEIAKGNADLSKKIDEISAEQKTANRLDGMWKEQYQRDRDSIKVAIEKANVDQSGKCEKLEIRIDKVTEHFHELQNEHISIKTKVSTLMDHYLQQEKERANGRI